MLARGLDPEPEVRNEFPARRREIDDTQVNVLLLSQENRHARLFPFGCQPQRDVNTVSEECARLLSSNERQSVLSWAEGIICGKVDSGWCGTEGSWESRRRGVE